MGEPGDVRADRWGIADEYWDMAGKRHVTSEATRTRLRQAMRGIDEPLPNPVRVVWSGQPQVLPEPAVIRLEDGTNLGAQPIIPGDLPIGYHQLQPVTAALPLMLMVAPPTCYVPPELRVWGWTVQLAACRSRESWGIGDLGDLRELGRWSRGLGAGLVLSGPLGAAAPVHPQQPSPYFPASRRFRNPLYIRVPEVPGAEHLGSELDRLDEVGRALNQERRIDRNAVFTLKMDALERIWARSGNVPELERFAAGQGEGLRVFATYCVLAEKLGPDWRAWPAELRRPSDPAVQVFARDNQARSRFHIWLQWVLDEQLQRAAAELPVWLDLPVGIDGTGPDAWQWQDVVAEGARVGAPPDLFSPIGQDWGVAPFIPERLRAVHYRPFIETVRASLRHAGGLRIDHVMGLFELFWLPEGQGATEGAYVQYPADELLAIVCIESQRARAVVVGEDLGTVHPRVRRRMAELSMLSYKLMLFEDEPPSRYPVYAVAAPTSHDLPTLAGMWTGRDVEDCRRAGVRPEARALEATRRRLMEFADVAASASPAEVIAATYGLLGPCPCAVVLAQLEDVLEVTERPNIPGAGPDWPNWSRALPASREDLQASPAARRVADALAGRARIVGS